MSLQPSVVGSGFFCRVRLARVQTVRPGSDTLQVQAFASQTSSDTTYPLEALHGCQYWGVL